jgi:hypothetical protein
MVARDLFGSPLPEAQQPRLRKIGYAARPGTGPKKSRCVQCLSCIKITNPGEEGYKCERAARVWDRPGSYIKPNAPACLHFSRRPFAKKAAA